MRKVSSYLKIRNRNSNGFELHLICVLKFTLDTGIIIRHGITSIYLGQMTPRYNMYDIHHVNLHQLLSKKRNIRFPIYNSNGPRIAVLF